MAPGTAVVDTELADTDLAPVPPPPAAPPTAAAASRPAPTPAAAGPGGVSELTPEPRPGRVLVAALLATTAAGWMVGGVFLEPLARVVAVLAGAAGVGGVALAVRSGRIALQYLLAPGGFILGYLVALVLPNATGITGTVPELVRAAIDNGGLAEPPIPFDPGWRFLTVVLVVFLGAASASLATSLGKPRLAVLVPLPVVLGGALTQPEDSDLLSGGVALVLLVGALLVSYTAELAEESEGGAVSRAFEVRQLLRGAGAMVAVLALLGVLSQASLLFPVDEDASAAEPQRPEVQPLSEVEDRPLFTVESSLDGPWRLGTLDEYDGSAWLLPPYDPDRILDPQDGGEVPGPPGPAATARFTVKDLGGFTLPAPANPQQIDGARGDVGFDPRTQVFRTRQGAAGEGFSYQVTAVLPPDGAALRSANTAAVPADLERFTEVSEPPVEVVQLLAEAPDNAFERLQALRAALYENVVAAGSGVPVDVNAARVAELLGGSDATPFEIVAGEALLARWSGLPARIGYGFNGGESIAGAQQFRPRDGANWLEVHLGELGWIPIVGTPPKARASLNADPRNTQPTIRPSDDLSLQVYLPLQNPNPLLFFQVVRYWVSVTAPFLALAALLVAVFPVPVKLWRRRQRRLWAAGRGAGGRIAVAYAGFRDQATDLGLDGAPTTPLDFLDSVAPDEEHEELAWLVTRALWGDLARDLRDDDAASAEELAGSLGRRLSGAQTVPARMLAAISRSSLRRPFDPGLPNPWPSPRPGRPRLARGLALLPGRRAARRRPALVRPT